MGGGDLNQKKSWHTSTMKNQERVWKSEKKALEERNKTRQLQREREEERAMEELARLNEQSGGKARAPRLEWMYAGAAADSVTGITQEQESYLLGKRRVDNLVLKDKNSTDTLGALVKAQSTPEAGLALASVSSSEVMRKAALDPMAEIERRRKKKMEEELARQLRLEKIRSREEKHNRPRPPRRDEDEEESKRQRRRQRDRADSPERHRRHKRRRYSDEGYRSRSQSPHRDRHHSRRHVGGRYREDSQPGRDSRSRSPAYSRREDSSRRYNVAARSGRHSRSTTPAEQRQQRRRHMNRDDSRSSSRSPDVRRRERKYNSYRSVSGSERTSRPQSPPDPSCQSATDNQGPGKDRQFGARDYSNGISSNNSRREADTTSRSAQSGTDKEAELAAKLAAMQADANQLEEDRHRRLLGMQDREAREHAEEIAERLRGGQGFKRKLNEQASKVDLSARLRRPGMERFDD